jgi:hypothetical protein
MAKRAKADCGANLVERSYSPNGARFAHFAGFRSGPGERQGDIVWDAVQIFNNLGTKPEPSRSKFALPPRIDLGRFTPQGGRPINFGNVDFATTVATRSSRSPIEIREKIAAD